MHVRLPTLNVSTSSPSGTGQMRLDEEDEIYVCDSMDFNSIGSRKMVCFPTFFSTTVLGGGFKYVSCSPRKLAKWSILTSIFFKWVGSTRFNHQLDYINHSQVGIFCPVYMAGAIGNWEISHHAKRSYFKPVAEVNYMVISHIWSSWSVQKARSHVRRPVGMSQKSMGDPFFCCFWKNSFFQIG